MRTEINNIVREDYWLDIDEKLVSCSFHEADVWLEDLMESVEQRDDLDLCCILTKLFMESNTLLKALGLKRHLLDELCSVIWEEPKNDKQLELFDTIT